MTELRELQVEDDGVRWSVFIRGESVSIVDDEGRERHRSLNHEMTAVHLASLLMERPFERTEFVDRVLCESARRFQEGEEGIPDEYGVEGSGEAF